MKTKLKYLLAGIVMLAGLIGCEPIQGVDFPSVGTPERVTNMMYLTVPDMKRVDHLPVYSGDSDEYNELLERSALHVNKTGFPWQEDKNVYIAGHRLGYPGTKSYLVFEDIDKLDKGDTITLEDDAGNEWRYEIYKKAIVEPDDTRVLESKGFDTVTLQSCTYPDYAKRILVVGKLIWDEELF